MDTAEKPGTRGRHITLDRKRAGKAIAGNRHDGFEVAGAGNQLTVWLVRHSQRKRGATDRLNLRSMAPVLDPTRSAFSFFACPALQRDQSQQRLGDARIRGVGRSLWPVWNRSRSESPVIRPPSAAGTHGGSTSRHPTPENQPLECLIAKCRLAGGYAGTPAAAP